MRASAKSAENLLFVGSSRCVSLLIRYGEDGRARGAAERRWEERGVWVE